MTASIPASGEALRAFRPFIYSIISFDVGGMCVGLMLCGAVHTPVHWLAVFYFFLRLPFLWWKVEMVGGGGNVGVSHPAIEWSASPQDGLSSPFRREMLPVLAAASRFSAGNPRGLDLPVLPVERALHPWAGGKVKSATITFWFQ
ncbi:unnamed protein product [Coccothraustes coccothraustes]